MLLSLDQLPQPLMGRLLCSATALHRCGKLHIRSLTQLERPHRPHQTRCHRRQQNPGSQACCGTLRKKWVLRRDHLHPNGRMLLQQRRHGLSLPILLQRGQQRPARREPQLQLQPALLLQLPWLLRPQRSLQGLRQYGLLLLPLALMRMKPEPA